MTPLELLKGRKAKLITEYNTPIELEIASVKEVIHSEETGPSTRENDWWPETREWKTYEVVFTNGAKKIFENLNDIDLV